MKSTTQRGLWTVEYGKLGATLKALQDYGVTTDHLARLRADPDYAKQVAKFMIIKGGPSPSVHHKIIGAIMGDNFFGVEDWSALNGVDFTRQQLRQVAKFPWSKDILISTCPFCGKVVKDCHFAFIGVDRLNGKPLTTTKMQELHAPTGKPTFYFYAPSVLYSEQKYAKESTMRWYLLHNYPVWKSENKTYREQVQMLTADYEVPSAVVEITKHILIARKTGFSEYPSLRARCTDITRNNGIVSVGVFDGHGPVANGCRDDDREHDLGIAASRKF